MHIWESDIDGILGVLRRFESTWYDDQPCARAPPPPPAGGSFSGVGAAGTAKKSPYETALTARLLRCLASGQPVPLLLPSAPWKTANRDKVLGAHPDLGEELGLARLNTLCEELQKVYLYGAVLVLVSDGPAYNDLLGIPEEDVYDYGCALRTLAKQRGFAHIRFTRLLDVLGLGVSDCLARAEYVAVADVCRRTMEEVFLPPGFDLAARRREDPDVEAAYRRHRRAAREDLRWGPRTPPAVVLDPALYAAETERVAGEMTKRMLAYEAALSFRYPDHVRLSGHESTGKAKIGIPLLPPPHGLGHAPWHCCVAITASGEYVTGYARDFRDPERYEIMMKDGRPYYVCERQVYNHNPLQVY